MQWFRMYCEFATDPKVQMLSEINQRRLVMLFCFKCNNYVTLHDNEIAFQLRITEKEWQETKLIFVEKGFIDKNNEVLNWEKRQYLSDSSAERVRKHREKKKQLCNVTVTPPDTDTDTDTDNKLPDCIPVHEWGLYKKHRGKKFKEDAQNLAINKLVKWHSQGHDVREILETSVMNGWAGIFLPKHENKKGKENGKTKLARETAELLESIRSGEYNQNIGGDY